MDRGGQDYCGHCPELSLFLCAIPFKVYDSSVWLSPGSSALPAVQCGEPTVKPLRLQSEEPGGEGCSKEDADQEAQTYLLTQALLPHQEEKWWERRRGRKSCHHSAISAFILSKKKKKHLSPSDPSAPCLVNQYGETFTDQITPIHSGPKKILTASPTISKAIAFFSHFLSFLPFPFLSHKV